MPLSALCREFPHFLRLARRSIQHVTGCVPTLSTPVLIVAVVACGFCGSCLAAAPDTASGLENCEWTTAGPSIDKSRHTQSEVEDELVRQLAIKLRQFDRCLDQEVAAAAESSAASPAQGSSVADASFAASHRSEQNQGNDAEGNPSDSAATDTRPGTATAGHRRDQSHSGGEASSATQPSVAETNSRQPRLPSTDREQVRRSAVEDDIARILREAAEQETDPARRAALWEEYDNYIKNL